jgi:hypothetical protein
MTGPTISFPFELNLGDISPRLTHPLTIHHLHNLRDLLARFVERQHEHVLVLIRATMTGRSHRAVQPRPAIVCRSKVVVGRDLAYSRSASINSYSHKRWKEEAKNLAI